MKSWIVLLVITWTIILVHSPVSAITYELNMQGTTRLQYSQFLRQIRDDIRDPNLQYGGTNLPVIRATQNPKFIRLNLRVPAGIVSLAVQRSNLYVLAYLARNDANIYRAYYFRNQITTVELNGIFPEATGTQNHQQIAYGESYPQIEGAAGYNRTMGGLGIKRLGTLMAAVNGRRHNNQNEARFLLQVIQMVAEAARFKYIEDLLVPDFDNDFDRTPPRIIILQNNWARISRETRDSNRGVFRQPLVLTSFGAPGFEWRVTNVFELDMGILLNVGNGGLLSTIYQNIFDNFSYTYSNLFV